MKAKSYGKVADELLSYALKHPHGTVGIDWGHERRTGGRYGDRKHKAAQKLVKEGILKHVGTSSSPLYSPQGGQSGISYATTYQLTDKGRAHGAA